MIGFGLSMLWVAVADADTTVWEWVNRDNSICYTNMEDRIPEMYKAKARSFMVTGLEDYSKYTPADQTEQPSE
jgi:hypothetical protein